MCYLLVKISFETISSLALEVTAELIQRAIIACPKLPKAIKLSPKNVILEGGDEIRIYPSRMNRSDMLSDLQLLKKRIPGVIVCGIPDIRSTVIATSSSDDGENHKILASGEGMLSVMATPGVLGTQTYSNHIMEVEQSLGIEAARTLIVKEIQEIFGNYGIKIDVRHVNLLADTMTYRGEVLGITRFGIEKMRDSVLMLASFEKTADHLFDAAVRGRVDNIDGVSECIIMGIPVPLGTGFFKLLHKVHGKKPPSRGLPLLAKPRVPGI